MAALGMLIGTREGPVVAGSRLSVPDGPNCGRTTAADPKRPARAPSCGHSILQKADIGGDAFHLRAARQSLAAVSWPPRSVRGLP